MAGITEGLSPEEWFGGEKPSCDNETVKNLLRQVKDMIESNVDVDSPEAYKPIEKQLADALRGRSLEEIMEIEREIDEETPPSLAS